MNDNLDSIYEDIKKRVFELMEIKNIETNEIAFDLGVDTQTFINNFNHRIDDMGFYFQALHLAENWEE